MASTSHHAAQPITLAVFRPWGDSSGAGCVRLAAAKVRQLFNLRKFFEQKKRFLQKKKKSQSCVLYKYNIIAHYFRLAAECIILLYRLVQDNRLQLHIHYL